MSHCVSDCLLVPSDALVENGRSANIEAVVNVFGTIMAAVRGEVLCEVTTAKVRVCGAITLH